MAENSKDARLNDLEKRTSDRGFLIFAKEYYDAYEIIQNNNPATTKYFAVKYYLLCHALELVMKALLRNYGETYTQLKAYRHDLAKLEKAPYHKYQIAVDPTSSINIRLVNELYSNKEFEYYLRGMKHVPEITALARITSLMIGKARFQIILGGDPRKLRGSG